MYLPKLKEFFEEYNLKQKDVATKLRISPKTISGWANYHDIIPLEKLVKLSNEYKISIDYLIGKTRNNNYKKLCTDKVIIGKRLAKVRKDNDKTIEYISKKINISNGAYCDYENGRNLIKTIYLLSLIDTYHNLSIDELLKEKNSWNQLFFLSFNYCFFIYFDSK